MIRITHIAAVQIAHTVAAQVAHTVIVQVAHLAPHIVDQLVNQIGHIADSVELISKKY